MNVNIHHKASVFSFLFSDPDALRELYCAIEGIDLPPDTPVDINTLSDILYMGKINDISFTIGSRLVVLIEHQSTINRNMPLRLLMYIAHIYEKITDRKKLYQRGLEKIPEPEFIVLYNGADPYPDRSILKLSEAFMDASGLRSAPRAPALELEVQVYNINKGRNANILAKSAALNGYSTFIDRIRENRKTMPLEAAMKAAVKYCIDHNVLKPFFETHSSEVFNMLLTEWNMEDAIAYNREEAWEEGREEGWGERNIQIAQTALAKGLPMELIHEITGLDLDAIRDIQAGV